jgi:sporulation protein YlmC with PRC-barrel domain
MKTELLDMMGLEVYTNDAIYLGNVDNIVVDLDGMSVHGVYLRNTNPLLVDESNSVLVPFRWIHSVGDIVLLKYFPTFVSLGPKKVRKQRKLLSEK